MTDRGNGNGHAAAGHDLVAPDLSFRDWVCQCGGITTFIGRISDGEDEESIRDQIARNPSTPPCATLFPVFLLTSQQGIIWHPQQGLATSPRQNSIAFFGNALFGRGAISRLHVQLTAFEFLSQQPEQPRRYLLALIDNAIKARRAAELGIVSAGQAG